MDAGVPLTWRFKLRPNVKFHDGTPFTADDVVYSIKRAKEPTSRIPATPPRWARRRKIDDLTVEFHLTQVDPIFLQHLDTGVDHEQGVVREAQGHPAAGLQEQGRSLHASNANGTGPYMLVSRAPGIRTTYKRNPNWWGRHEGNVQEVVYTPISNDATRLAALLSGEIDFVLDPAPQDVRACAAPTA